MGKRKLNASELATILAALRLWQRSNNESKHTFYDFGYFDNAVELSETQIDKLCERINFGGGLII